MNQPIQLNNDRSGLGLQMVKESGAGTEVTVGYTQQMSWSSSPAICRILELVKGVRPIL